MASLSLMALERVVIVESEGRWNVCGVPWWVRVILRFCEGERMASLSSILGSFSPFFFFFFFFFLVFFFGFFWGRGGEGKGGGGGVGVGGGVWVWLVGFCFFFSPFFFFFFFFFRGV